MKSAGQTNPRSDASATPGRSAAAGSRPAKAVVTGAGTSGLPPSQVRLRWLLTALGLLVIAAGCCAYLTLCLLFLQGQWQLLYHPSRVVSVTPADKGLDFTLVKFGVTEAGATQLTGWWLPAAEPKANTPRELSAVTVLYLHGGDGSLSDTLPALIRLHALGCALFAFDYRGYGASAPAHPEEAQMIEDARKALTYLLSTRHVAASSLVVWGRGIGATVAAEAVAQAAVAQEFPGQQLPGQQRRLVMEEVSPSAMSVLRQDPRTRLLPVRLLLRDRLDPEPALQDTGTAKLFLESPRLAQYPGASPADPAFTNETRHFYSPAANPKMLVSSADTTTIEKFLAAAPTPLPESSPAPVPEHLLR